MESDTCPVHVSQTVNKQCTADDTFRKGPFSSIVGPTTQINRPVRSRHNNFPEINDNVLLDEMKRTNFIMGSDPYVLSVVTQIPLLECGSNCVVEFCCSRVAVVRSDDESR